MTKGFIFNLEGIILNTDKYQYQVWKELLRSLNISFSETQIQTLKGFDEFNLFKKILNESSIQLSNDEFNKLTSKKNSLYLDYINQISQSDISSDIPRILNYLKTHKQLTALSSIDKNAKFILRKLDLLDEFHVIIDGNAIISPKPNSEIFLKAAEKLHIHPSNCFVFENTQTGIEAVKSAKMTPICIGNLNSTKNINEFFPDTTYITNNYLKELISTKKVK